MSKVLIKLFQQGKTYTKMKHASQVASHTSSTSSKVLTKMSTKTVTTPVKSLQTRMPEGMFPREMTMADIRKIMNSRYNKMRYGDKSCIRSMSKDATTEYNAAIRKQSKDILIDDEVDWVYRKPLSITDRIQSFEVIPKERISMNINTDPKLIDVLDRYISKGEVIVNGELIKTVHPPLAYYKVDTGLDCSFLRRTDPVTMYFRENATKEHINDIVQITKAFRGPSSCVFDKGALKDASWLAYCKEHSPDDLYNLYKRALKIDPKLAEAIDVKVAKGGVGRVKGIDYGKDLPYMERYRFRISDGTYLSIESVVNDYEKALGKINLDKIV